MATRIISPTCAHRRVARFSLRSPTMRLVALFVVIAGCAEQPVPPPTPLPIDTVWARTIRPGDLVVLVPGTGAYDYLAVPIEAMPGAAPVVEVRANAKVASDAIVFEQAIAAAHRAGVADADLESGALTFALWGAGFTKLSTFVYGSYEGLHVPIQVIGGENTCATGLVIDNLLNYTTANADADATDLHARIRAYLAAHPAPTGAVRNVIVASHSWGGAVSEYLAKQIESIEAAAGPLVDGDGVAPMAFTIAAGVPAFVPNYPFAGPGLRDYPGGSLYEIDRPDDPVHAMNPSGNPDGHQYDILFGDAFQGSYGVTTTELSCRGVAGECPLP